MMLNSGNSSYRAAGVDVEAGYRAVELMKAHIARTAVPGVLSGIGGFGGLFELDLEGYKKPVLVSGADGVGTKLKIAFILDKHDTIGQDCVAMCVNDVVCGGAKPLFFLDYIASSKSVPEKIAEIVKGIADGCCAAGCALIGGETAEMPGFYSGDEYDLAGFTVGIVEKDKIIDGSSVKAGDALIALKSSGLHSNGFSLVRKVFEMNERAMGEYVGELSQSVGEALLTPTRIYVKPLLKLMESFRIKAVSNITGGGFYENIPRMLPRDMGAFIKAKDIDIPPVFELISARGGIPKKDMFSTFNMGAGMFITAAAEDADGIVSFLNAEGETAYIAGEVFEGPHEVKLEL